MALIGFEAITAGAAVGVAIGAGLGAAAGPSSTAMQVDLDEAPKLIQGLKDAVDKLQEAYDAAVGINSVGAPGKDPYSGNVTTTMKTVAGGDPGGYGWANEAARQALLKTIENIEKSIASYQETDGAARDSLT
ncbi:hypothetical protein [Umezawaea sp. Da 62-37]|uniref:hypothetical protein n=1 Tax=Umezawaea sp. Da 62-37 TaxID=3075927 RepID=UPI0028F73618|nr:hypothetical protein [Umezawaea sp. Da 62-37]WNV89919.1 hypothetical protein RM788_16955 [Umezawaea sp. Da 62-37]